MQSTVFPSLIKERYMGYLMANINRQKIYAKANKNKKGSSVELIRLASGGYIFKAVLCPSEKRQRQNLFRRRETSVSLASSVPYWGGGRKKR